MALLRCGFWAPDEPRGRTDAASGCNGFAPRRPDALAGSNLLLSENNAGLAQIIGGKLDLDFIAGDDADEVLAHLARNMREDDGAIGKRHAEHRSGQNVL